MLLIQVAVKVLVIPDNNHKELLEQLSEVRAESYKCMTRALSMRT
jgi:hypothetical protein